MTKTKTIVMVLMVVIVTIGAIGIGVENGIHTIHGQCFHGGDDPGRGQSCHDINGDLNSNQHTTHSHA